MDNLTHSLVGVLVAKTGLERVSPYATTAAVIAANAPDLDLISVVGGRWSYLEHHRGFSHSIVGTLAISIAIPLIIWLVDRASASFRHRPPRVRLPGLIVVCLVAGATHPLLDWTNNYGVRPFMPWSDRWYYGDLVFIMDPWLWLILGGTVFLLTAKSKIRAITWATLAAVLSVALILAKVYSVPSSGSRVEIATMVIWFAGLSALAVLSRSKVRLRWNGRAAVAALLIVPLYWGVLAVFHRAALDQARAAAGSAAIPNAEPVERVVAMPTFANPFRWQVLAESDRSVYRFAHDLRAPAGDPAGPVRFVKPAPVDHPLINLAARDPRARVFLGFARFPFARLEGDCSKSLVVRFADLRYTEPGAGRGAFALDVPVDCVGEFRATLPPN